MQHAVARRPRRDLQTIEDAHAGADERTERAREACDGGLALEVSEHWRLEERAVDHELAVRRLVVPLDADGGGYDRAQEDVPPRLERLRQEDDELRRPGQLDAGLREHRLERRNRSEEHTSELQSRENLV